MAGHVDSVPRVIALIDLPDLRAQVKRAGGEVGSDLTPVIRQLEAGLTTLDPEIAEAGLRLGTVYVYSPVEMDRPSEIRQVVYRGTGVGAKRECPGSCKVCTHCHGGNVPASSGQGRDNPISGDLIQLARHDAYDWGVLVSSDTLLVPVVRFVQSRGRKIVHGCFPPVAADLTKECWASIDLRGLTRAPEDLPRISR